MTTTYPAAIDEMFNLFKATLAATLASVGINPGDVVVRYFGRDLETVPPVNKFMVEVSQLTSTDRQTGFGVSTRLYTATGTLYMKVFAPQVGANNYRKGQQLADGLKKGFRPRQTAGSVWYRQARVQELLPEKGAYRFNVSADYTYDERQ